jgi:hypothetical protein
MKRLVIGQWNILAGELALPQFFPHVLPASRLCWLDHRSQWVSDYIVDQYVLSTTISIHHQPTNQPNSRSVRRLGMQQGLAIAIS